MSKGWVNTQKLLEEMGEGVLEAGKKALAEGAEMVVQEAKNRCPVYKGSDHRVVPGTLRDSIRAVKKKGGAEYKITADAETQDGLKYGRLVEFSPRINKPFMYPAMDAQRDAVKEKIVEAVKAAVRRAK